MIITFGSGFYGKIASVNNQWIETKFFGIMFIPIFPLSSMFVTASEFRGRKGMEIPLHRKSVIAAYSRMFSFIVAVYFICMTAVSDAYRYENPVSGNTVKLLIMSVITFSAWIYFCFFYGRASGEDFLLRAKLGSITGLYILPQWLEYMQIKNMLSDFEHVYRTTYPDGNWKNDVKNGNSEPEKRPLLFGLALFNCMVYDLPENDALYIEADKLYELKLENKEIIVSEFSI